MARFAALRTPASLPLAPLMLYETMSEGPSPGKPRVESKGSEYLGCKFRVLRGGTYFGPSRYNGPWRGVFCFWKVFLLKCGSSELGGSRARPSRGARGFACDRGGFCDLGSGRWPFGRDLGLYREAPAGKARGVRMRARAHARMYARAHARTRVRAEQQLFSTAGLLMRVSWSIARSGWAL